MASRRRRRSASRHHDSAAPRSVARAGVATADSHRRRRTALVGALLVAATLGVFGTALKNGFVSFDDELYVVRNPHVRTGLTLPNVAWAFTATAASNWHPLAWISHQLDVSLFGLAPPGHHATSVVFHAANVLLVFLLLRRGTGRLSESAAAAALFALHPLRVESVAWVAERKDVLALFFGLLAIAAWSRWVSSRRAGAFAAALVLFAASLMSKATLVTLPLLLLVIDFWPLARGQPRRRLLLEKVPFAVLSVAAAVLVWRVQRASGATSAPSQPFGARLEQALVSIVRYLGKTFWPADLAVAYPEIASSLAWKSAAAALLIAGITAAAVAVRRRHPYVLAGWAWYLVALAPVVGIVELAWQSMADRSTLVPSIGVAVAVTWLASDLLAPRVPARALAAAAAAVVVALAVLSVRQVSRWRDSLTLYEHAVAVTGPNETMQINLGNELARRGRTEEASRRFEEALRIAPGSKGALYALGSLDLAMGRLAEGRARLGEAARLHPDFAEAHVAMASSFAREKRPAEAIAEAKRAIEIRPNDAGALYVWGAALDSQGDEAGAEEKYRAAIAARPDYAEAHQNLGDLLAARGQLAEAAAEFQAALAANPDFAEARQSLEAVQQKQRPPS
jgi:tetratricopeptide (TPR) repeat protein